MSILMIVLAVLPLVIKLIQWWKAKHPANAETLQEATDKLRQINEIVAKRKRLGPIDRMALAQLRRRCDQANEVKVTEGTPTADAFITQCGLLIGHCQRMGIDMAAFDSDLSDLRGK